MVKQVLPSLKFAVPVIEKMIKQQKRVKIMGDAFDILMVTHAELSKGYFSAMKLILDINNEDMETVSFEAGEALDVFRKTS